MVMVEITGDVAAAAAAFLAHQSAVLMHMLKTRRTPFEEFIVGERGRRLLLSSRPSYHAASAYTLRR
jgi:hypothetical protein